MLIRSASGRQRVKDLYLNINSWFSAAQLYIIMYDYVSCGINLFVELKRIE